MDLKKPKPVHEEEPAQFNVHDREIISQIIKMVREEMVAYQSKLSADRYRRVVLKTAASIEFVLLDDILRCEAEGRYTRVIFTDRHFLLVSMHLKEIELALDSFQFLRCHNSHLINRTKIKRFNKSDGGYFEMINGDQVPVARARKEHIMSQLDDSPDKRVH